MDAPDDSGGKVPRSGLKPPWQPGQSGNKKGRPQGSRNRVTVAVEALLDGEGEALTRKAIELAKGGDLMALRICLDRILPPRKDRPIAVELPKLETAADAMRATSAIVEAVGRGDLTPSEGAEVTKAVDSFHRSLELVAFDERLTQLETKVNR